MTAPSLPQALALTTASQIAATTSVLAFTAIPTLVAAGMGLSPHLIGYQVSLIYAVGILFSIMAGGLVKRLGAGRVGQIALVAAGIGFCGLASGKIAGVAAGSALIGLGYGLVNPSSSHILSRLAPAAKRNLVFSIKQAGVPLGGVTAALAVPPLAHWLGWQWAMVVLAAATMCIAAIYIRYIPQWDGDRDPSVPIMGGIRARQALVWRDSSLSKLAIMGFLYSAMQLSLSSFMVAMLIEDFSWSALAAASCAAAMQASGAFGRVFWGFVADRLGSGFLVLALVGALQCAAGFGFMLLDDAPAVGFAMILLAGLTALGWNGVAMAETAHASPKGGTLTGEVLAWTFLGVVAGPAGFAALYGLTGDYVTIFRLFALLSLLGAALALAGHRRRPR